MESEDADPPQFWARVLQALQACPAVPADSLLATMKPPPQFDRRFVSNLVNACQDQAAPVVLVLEDLHLISDTASMASLRDAIRRGLGNLHLVIATRSDPSLPLQRRRLAGQLTEIRAEDLAFDAPEAVQLLEQYDLHLQPDQLQSVLTRTEGWAAGIRLVALALASSPDVDQAVSELAGDQRTIADFFVEEVLDHLAPHLTDFLLDTCVPRRICADLVNRLTDRDDGQLVLAGLERDNLFVVALDGRRSWYRYHHLFGELLRHRLAAHSPARVRELHLISAHWFAEHDEPIEACRHLAEAGAWQELARFMIRTAGAHMLGVQRHALVEVLRRAPGELVLGDAEVATAAAIASYAEYDANAVHAHVAQAREMLSQLSGVDLDVTDAILTTLDAVAAWMDGDAEQEVRWAGAALTELSHLTPAEVPALPAYRGGASVVLGMGMLWTGHLDEADALLTRTIGTLGTQQAMTSVLAVHLHGHLAVLRAMQGRLREARSEATTALDTAERSGWMFLPQSGMALMAVAFTQLTSGESEKCALTLERCRSSLGALEDRFTTTGLALVQARLEIGAGNPAAAAATMARLHRQGAGWPMPWFLARWCELVGLEVAIAAGHDERRDALLRRLETDWGPARPEAQRVVTVARAHLAGNRPEECLRVLAPVTGGAPVDLVPEVEAWVLTALAQDRLRHDAAATGALDQALAVAEPEGIARPFLAGGERMKILLERHQRLATAHGPFVDSLVAKFAGGREDGSEAQLLEKLTNRERSVLQLLPTMMSNSEIADELFVSVNTVKVHLKSLYRKLGVNNRRQAVTRARAIGLLGGGTGAASA